MSARCCNRHLCPVICRTLRQINNRGDDAGDGPRYNCNIHHRGSRWIFSRAPEYLQWRYEGVPSDGSEQAISMKSQLRRWGGIVVLAVILAAALWGPAISNSGRGGDADTSLINGVMSLVEKKYIVPVTSDQLVTGALKGMLANLDPHSSYMDETEYQQLMNDSRGQFGGVGIE